MTVIPTRNFKVWLQLYVNFFCVCVWLVEEGGGEQVLVKRVNKRPWVGVGVGGTAVYGPYGNVLL